MNSKFAPVTLGRTEFSRTVGAFTLTDTMYPAGLRLPRHAHARPAISLALEGRFTQTYDGRTVRECGALDLLFEPPEAIHRNHFPKHRGDDLPPRLGDQAVHRGGHLQAGSGGKAEDDRPDREISAR